MVIGRGKGEENAAKRCNHSHGDSVLHGIGVLRAGAAGRAVRPRLWPGPHHQHILHRRRFRDVGHRLCPSWRYPYSSRRFLSDRQIDPAAGREHPGQRRNRIRRPEHAGHGCGDNGRLRGFQCVQRGPGHANRAGRDDKHRPEPGRRGDIAGQRVQLRRGDGRFGDKVHRRERIRAPHGLDHRAAVGLCFGWRPRLHHPRRSGHPLCRGLGRGAALDDGQERREGGGRQTGQRGLRRHRRRLQQRGHGLRLRRLGRGRRGRDRRPRSGPQERRGPVHRRPWRGCRQRCRRQYPVREPVLL